MSITISSSKVGASSYVSAVSASRVAKVASSATGDGSDSSSVSGPAAMLSKLRSLQKSDPAKFKEAMTAIAKKLTKESDGSTDDKQKSSLKDMASRFSSAGESGDLSALQPSANAGGAGGAKGGGGPPPGGGGAKPASSSSSSSSSSKSTEAADANEDGTVTETERAAYEAKQEASGSSPSKRAAHAYAKLQGGPADAMKSTMSDIDGIVEQYAA